MSKVTPAALIRRIGFSLVALGLVLSGCSDDDNGGGNGDCPGGFVLSDTGRTCVYSSLTEVTRTQCGDVWEDCDVAGTPEPNLACLNEPDNPPANPPSVTLMGFADIFSSGPETVNGVVVQVFRQSDLNDVENIDEAAPVSQTTLEITQPMVTNQEVRACFEETDDIANHQIECPMPTDDCLIPCQDSLSGNEFCYQGSCYGRLRYEVRYEIPNVPTHEFLVIRSLGPDGVDDNTWGIMIQYNVYLRTTDPEYNETLSTYEMDVNLISRQDWVKIPTVMGLPSGVTSGNGAIAGEVHDCEGIRLTGAQVAMLPLVDHFSYFNGNPVDTVPSPTRLPQGTNRLSLYSAMNVPPGPIEIEAWGLINGTPTILGYHQARVFPDSATIISINDGKPPVQ